MSGKGGNSGNQQVTQSNVPWEGQQPHLSWLYGQARDLPPGQPYPFPGFVPFSPSTAQAMQATTNRAMMGSPLLPAAQNQALATTRGDYLYGGPGFNQAFGAAARQITPMVQGQFERSGRFGGGLAQEAHTRALGDAFAGLYDRERQRQMGATALSPSLAEADYADIGRLYGVGGMQEAKAGEALADAMSRWGYQQQEPYGRLGTQSQVIQAGYPGGMSTRNQPLPQTSPFASMLGGGLLGYWAGGPSGITGLGLSPWGGAAAGAALGLLGSK